MRKGRTHTTTTSNNYPQTGTDTENNESKGREKGTVRRTPGIGASGETPIKDLGPKRDKDAGLSTMGSRLDGGGERKGRKGVFLSPTGVHCKACGR